MFCVLVNFYFVSLLCVAGIILVCLIVCFDWRIVELLLSVFDEASLLLNYSHVVSFPFLSQTVLVVVF